MKRYLAFVLFALITTLTFAQRNYQDVVYLKNGSIIRGIIIEQIPNKSIKIETADRNVFVFQIDEIEKFTKEPFKRKRDNSINNSSLEHDYKGIVELGYQIGVGKYHMDRVKLNIINGCEINPYFSLGLGTGLRYYFDVDMALIPVFADFRANLTDNIVSPYFSLGVGYTFDATDSFEPEGFLLNPTVGANFKVSDKYSIHFGLGYDMQKLRFSTYNLGAISINAGISF